MITDPQGIDLPIQTLQAQFTAHLFAGKTYSSNGRAFLNTRDGVIPEIYNGSDEYEDVLLDDTKDAISFFTVNPVVDIHGFEAYGKVNIHFFVNLSTLSLTQEAIRVLVQKEINCSPFQVVNFISGKESVKDFAVRRPELLDMQPYYCFKFECSITYKIC